MRRGRAPSDERLLHGSRFTTPLVKPTSMMAWGSPATLAEEARRRAVHIRWQKAVRRQIAVNRLAGFATPGTGGLWEEATKKGELRHTAAIMHARCLLDEDPERLVEHVAKMEEERHEAVAALKLRNVVILKRQIKQIAEANAAKTKAEALEARCRVLQESNGRLREEARLARRSVHEAVFRATQAAEDRIVRLNAQTRVLQAELSRDEDHWMADIEYLERQVRDLHALTDFMIKTPGKRARPPTASSLVA